MSISDDLMWRYFELLTDRTSDDLAALRQSVTQEGVNPRDIKLGLAHELVARFRDGAAADEARRAFVDRFQRKQIPTDLPEQRISIEQSTPLTLAQVLKASGLVSSTSEALRMVSQGAVRLDGTRVQDGRAAFPRGAARLLQVGKRRAARVRVD
jgi:tyrosyl-tRNA synthetase